MEDKHGNIHPFFRSANSRTRLYRLGLFLVAVVNMAFIILADQYFRAGLQPGRGWSNIPAALETFVFLLIWGGGGLLLGALWLILNQARKIQLQRETLKSLEGEVKKGWVTAELLKNEVPHASRADVRQQFSETGEWRGETIQTPRDGTQDVDASASALREESGAIPGYLSANRDITERKQMEAVLRENTEFISNLLRNAPAAIYIIGIDDRIRLVNRAWEQAMGLSSAEVVDRFIEEIAPPETAQELKKQNLTVKETGAPLEIEEEINARSYFTVKFPLYDTSGQITSIGGISVDITDRKQAEKALQHTEALLRTVLTNIPLTIFATDQQGVFTVFEGRGLERVGLKPSHIVGLSASEMYGALPIQLHGSEIVDGKEVIRRALAGETLTAAVEIGGIHYDNHVAPIYDPSGSITGIVGVAIDISERKHAEDALRRSEQKYRQLVELTHDLVWSVDTNGFITYISPAARQIYEREPEEMIGRPFTDFVPAEQVRAGYLTLESAMRTGETVASSISHVYHRDGREIVLSTKTVALKDESGKTTGLVGTSQDITERVRAEEALRASEKLWRTVFDAANDSILILNEHYHVIAHNQAAEKMYARPLTGLNLFDLRYRFSQEDIHIQMQGFIRENGGRFESVHVRADGSTFPVEVSNKPFLSEGKQRFVHIVRDMTAHKTLEENLRQAEMRYRTLVEQIPPIIYLAALDQHLGVTYISPRIHTLGFTQEEWVADPELWFRQIHPEDQERISRELDEIERTGQGHKMEYRMLTREGDVRWFLDDTMEVSDQEGRFLFRQGIMLDITSSKQAEEMLRLQRDRLAELSRQLVTVRENEQRAIGRELHDQIGQMLTALRITLETLPHLPPETAALKIKRARDVTDELLNRVSSLSLKLRPSMLDDQGLLPALIWHIRHYQEQSGLKVMFRHSGLHAKRFDPEIETTIYRVIQEALTNVARHAQATLIDLDIDVEPGQFIVHIRDNGQGFDPVSALKKNRGLGGMRERVILLHGKLWIDSEPGSGTHISLRLPIGDTA